ncbi:hypothetical protein MRX96_034517 [Rhipicephalus microplus]
MNTELSVGELSEADVSAHVEGVVQYVFSDDMLKRIRSEQANDPECAWLLEACMQGWPAKHYTPQLLKPFWAHRGNIAALKHGSKTEVPRARSFVLLKDRDPAASKLKEKPYAETGVISSFSHTEEKQAP